MSLLRRPAVLTALALALGLGSAMALAWWGPLPGALTVELPSWLAQRLSDSGERHAVLAHPEALWLMPLAVVPMLVAVLARSLVDLPRVQLGLQLLARTLLLVAVAIALALPSLQSPIQGKTVVFVVDVSDSVDDGQLEHARALVAAGLDQVRREDEAGLDREDRTRVALVTYAQRAHVHELEDQTQLALALQRPDAAEGLASDHAGALRLAAALVDPDTEGRMVLVTDATGSLAEREDLALAARELAARGIALHTRSFPPAAREDVLIEGVFLPDELRVGQTFEVRVDLSSTTPRTLTLELEHNGKPNELEPSRQVALRGGTQQVTLPARVTEAGPVVFRARLRTEGLPATANRSPMNDEAAVAAEVRGRPRVLLAGDTAGSPLARALRSDHLEVDAVDASALPRTDEELRRYDLVVLHDVGASRVAGDTRQALVRYVEEHGGGFIMIGGENSFGVGGFGGTTLERILPVRFEGERQREQPKLALVLVIDKSGSMSAEDKLDLVKEASRATARTLDPTDEIGVIAFDSKPHVLVRVQPAANRIRIAGDIRRLTSGGGTNALPALREAYLQLAGSNALVKHVILLSDGQSPEGGINALIGDMRDADITVSSVGVGAGAGKDLLRRVANRGRGRFYFSQDGTDVPRIFSRETREVTRNAIVERSLLPRVAKNVQALRGLDFARAPGLRGIVPVKAKRMSEMLLKTHEGDPLLVRGRRGLGRTAAFASDAKARWAARWLTWSGFSKFWSQVARDTMRQGATLLGGARIQLSSAAERGTYRAVVDVDAPEGFANDLYGELEIVDPNLAKDDPARTHTVPLSLSAPGRYEAELRDIESGQRLVKAKLYDQTQSPRRLAAEAVAQVSVPYPAELSPAQLRPDPQWLQTVASATHEGEVDPLLTTPGEANGRTRAKPLWPYVLWGLVIPLLILDLLLRRVALGRRRVLA
ncbi:VWA domain-containing protein [Paraliomyxa miuraensis]|uniref:VWA domain-containing protein n=1 Tax=Paraliomyxa miuraensis TaxID=376150 RepID=UPI0022521626|nr:VWA domain-containing protein [Paraliomyxa miuraensis]MCX4240098.1 VWA domain-containing protein [Paraliomyxa miuraensis]